MLKLNDPKTVAALGLVIVVSIWAITKALKSLNPFADSEAETKGEKAGQALAVADYFSPQYVENLWQSGVQQTDGITDAAASKFAREIWDAKGALLQTDAEERAVGVFRQLRSKTQVSRLAKKFASMYNRDLFSYLQSFFGNTPEKWSEIKSLVDKMYKGVYVNGKLT